MITKNELEKNFLAAMYCIVGNSIKNYYLNNWKINKKNQKKTVGLKFPAEMLLISTLISWQNDLKYPTLVSPGIN